MKKARMGIKRVQKGFTLIELMIVIAIIGILAAIAIPQYQQYTKKARFTEIVNAAAPYKLAVDACYQEQANTMANCATPGTNGIPADTTAASGLVASVATGANGVITATAVGTAAVPVNGLSGETYILTPTAGAAGGSASLTWAKTGTCTGAAIC